jgi:hypothetical protein
MVLVVGAVVVVTTEADPELLAGGELDCSEMTTVTMTPKMITTISVESIATPRSDRRSANERSCNIPVRFDVICGAPLATIVAP